MSNTQRPAARKPSRSADKKASDALDSGVRFIVGDQVHEVRIGEITPRLAREVRRETGSTVMQLIEEVGEAADLDTIAALIWIARRIQGENVTFDDIDIDYGTVMSDDFQVDVAGPDEEGDGGPEA